MVQIFPAWYLGVAEDGGDHRELSVVLSVNKLLTFKNASKLWSIMIFK